MRYFPPFALCVLLLAPINRKKTSTCFTSGRATLLIPCGMA
jgi:hypothetical protein